jgi:hypothetical protein
VGVLFFYSGKGKLFDDHGHAPPALKEQFQGTFLEKFPGVDAAWMIIGILELAIVAHMLFRLLRREFLPTRNKSILSAALALALLTYACLSFGQTSTGNNQGTASLYLYFAGTAIIIMLVAQLARAAHSAPPTAAIRPPNRPPLRPSACRTHWQRHFGRVTSLRSMRLELALPRRAVCALIADTCTLPRKRTSTGSMHLSGAERTPPSRWIA